MIVPTRNILADNATKTFTSFPEVAGTNVLRWKNPNGFNASWAVQVGETGEQQTEIINLGVQTPAGTAGSFISNTLYPHPENTPLYAIKYDQVVFEVSTAGTLGTAAPLTNGTLNLQINNLLTRFDDTNGSTAYAYKTYFRSSSLSVNSTESDWITFAGFSFYSLANLRDRSRSRLWNGKYLSDDVLTDWINEWKDELTNAAIAVNEDYSLGTTNVSFGTNGLGTITNTDFKQLKRVWITYNGQDNFQSQKMDSNVIWPNQVFNASQPHHYYQGDSVIVINPAQSGGTAGLEYYKLNTRLVEDTDELPVPMRGYTKSFNDYLEGLALKKDGKYTESLGPLSDAAKGKAQFIVELSPRDKSGPDYIQITEPLSGDY